MNETTVIKNELANVTSTRLGKCGFTRASEVVQAKKILASKLMLAYEHYRYVTQEKLREFNARLKKQTQDRSRWNYQELAFCPIGSYEGVPPASVLDALEKAQALVTPLGVKVFDAYEVAYIRHVPDPLLFGIVEGCSDKFYIAEWGKDVSITDLLKAHEG